MVGGSISDPNPDSYQVYLAQQLANTYADLIKRAVVREGAMESLGLTWLPPYEARIVPNTQLMEVTVTDTDPGRAQAVAAELVRQLIRVSPAGNQEQGRQEFINRELDELQLNIEATKAEITARQEELATLFSARQIADTENQIAALQNKLATLQTNYTNLLSTTQEGAINAINVVEEARPGTPVNNNLWINVLLAAAVGLVLAAGGAYLMEYLDDSVKNPDDVRKHLDGANTIGAVPLVTKGDLSNGELIMLERGHAPAAEAFRILRTNLQFSAVAHTLDRLLVTSASPGEGKSFVTANLAVAAAQGGKRVVVIDADMHRPRQHKVWKLANNMGLSTALLGDPTRAEQFLQATELPNLHIMTTGPLPPNPAELLGSERMRLLLETLNEQYDMVFIDSPPTTAVADTAVASKLVDGVLLVVNTGKTSREMARRALNTLSQVNAYVAGIVLNRMPTRGSSYYYYYHYNYSYYRQYYRRDDDIDARAVQTAAVNPLLQQSSSRPANGNGTAGHERAENGYQTNGSGEYAQQEERI